MPKSDELGQPEMPQEVELFLSLHTLNSAFSRIVTVLGLLSTTRILTPQSVQTTTASLEALRTALNFELREALGQGKLDNLDQFSKTLRRMEHELIEECMDPLYLLDITTPNA